MARELNKGLIFTNDRCIACGKCFGSCGASGVGANIVQDNNKGLIVKIDGDRCSNCGICISTCLHSGREYRDDCSAFLAALNSGEKISVIVASSFYVLYGDKASSILGYLRSLGVDKIYDAAFGAEISVYAQLDYCKSHEDRPVSERAFISPMCSAFVNAIELFHPVLIDKLIPVQSPMMCTAIYARKYLGDTNKFAYFGPCIAAGDEIRAKGVPGIIGYNVTFEHFMSWVEGIPVEKYSAEADLKSNGYGDIIPLYGGFADSISKFISSEKRIISYKDMKPTTYQELKLSLGSEAESIQPYMADVYACGSGCQFGSGIEQHKFNKEAVYSYISKLRLSVFENYNRNGSHQASWQALKDLFKDIDLSDFAREFDKTRGVVNEPVPEEKLEATFREMLKDTPEKRRINCGSCGFQSCKAMANAIAKGYIRKENCIRYMNDMMLNKYMYDPLTGLYTETLFMQQSKKLLSEHSDKKYFIAFGNISRLKTINDIYSFDTGDKILRWVGTRLSNIAGSNGIVAYFGNGTYCMICEYSQENIDRLTSIEAFDFSSFGVSHYVIMQIGIYIIEDNAENLRRMINYASMASQEKAAIVKNVVTIFRADSRQRLIEESDISTKMKQALSNKEFVLWFQPQYSAHDKSITGAEALCRWVKPDGSIISPGVFIPIAEKSDFMRDLDKAIWKQAFETVKRWIDTGIDPPPVSVNISRISLETDEMISYISQLGNEYAIPERYIHFEITESAYFANQDELIRRVNMIRELGYEIAMDDFGSGYSSLNVLKDMPIDILKLDMGFLRDDTNMDRGGTIISSVARMAGDLGFITIAEGVETSVQVDFLRSIGVNVIQGYVYAKPMPEKEYVNLLIKSGSSRDIVSEAEVFKIEVGRFLDPSSYESMMFENMTGPSVLLEYDESGDELSMIRINRKGLGILGCDGIPITAVKAFFRKLMATKSGRQLKEVAARSCSTGEELSCELTMREQRFQKEIWIRACLRPFDKRGGRHMIYAFYDDITKERLVENTLKIANFQMSYILDKTVVGNLLMHVRVDVRDFPNSMVIRVLRCNEEFSQLSGYSEAEVLSWTEKETLGVVHPIDRPGFLIAAGKAVRKANGGSSTYIYRACHREGYYIKVKVIITAISTEDKSLFLSTSFFMV